MKYTALIGDNIYEVNAGAPQSIELNGVAHQIDFRNIDNSALYSLLIDNHSWEVLAERDGDEFRISIDGELYVVNVQDERTRKIEKGLGKAPPPSGELTMKAPMPGLVRGVNVEVGQEIEPGQGIVILEAMKMENELRAPRPGVIKEVRVKVGDKVDQGQALVVIK